MGYSCVCVCVSVCVCVCMCSLSQIHMIERGLLFLLLCRILTHFPSADTYESDGSVADVSVQSCNYHLM